MRRTIYVAVAVWIASLLLAVPEFPSSHVRMTRVGPICDAYYDWPPEERLWYIKFRTMYRFGVLFACPLIVIGGFYSAIAFTLLFRSHEAVDTSCGPTLDAATRQLQSRRKVSSTIVLHTNIQGGPKIGTIFVCLNFTKY